MEYEYSSIVPLGVELFELQPIDRTLMVIGSVESPQFVGLRRVQDGERRELLDGAGDPVARYPRFVSFRVTATAYPQQIIDGTTPFPQQIHTDLNDYLLGLKFRLKVFHGLRVREIQPVSVHMMGVPAEEPSEDRVYVIGVDLPNLPINDRVVLEVLGPDGDRLTKFHLDLL